MTKQELLRIYDALILCAEQGKYGETKETVRKWLEWAVDAYGIEKENEGFKRGRELERMSQTIPFFEVDKNI